MKRSVQFLALLAGVVAASVANAEGPKGFEALSQAPAARARTTLGREVARARAVVGSMDAERGLPSFVWAVGGHPASMRGSAAQAARSHLVDFASVYGITPRALDAAEVKHVHDTGRGGIVVTMRQRMGGVEVYGSDMKVLMRRNLDLVALAGSLEPTVSPAGKPGVDAFTIADERAVAIAFGDLFSIVVPDASLAETTAGEGGYLRFELVKTDAMKQAAVDFLRPARVKKIWYRMPTGLVPAYVVELYATRAGAIAAEGYEYVVSASDGQLLQRRNLKKNDAFNYRVWADTAYPHTPFEGPQEDFTPHPSGVPDGSQPAFVPPQLISMEGFNKNPSGEADPWLPAAAQQTVGNNVDAHTDWFPPDGFSNGDMRALLTGPQTFGLTYDTSLDPQDNEVQAMAAVTQLFYTTNWLHDWWYDSGFNEGAGNAQLDNFGRGGIGQDPLLAQAQDYAFTNNAQIYPFEEGASPVMEMFLNDAPVAAVFDTMQLGPVTMFAGAQFGPASFDVTAPVVLADDGAGGSLGCTAITNNVAGQIVLLDRGTCSFKTKAYNAQVAGAVGAVIANHTAGAGVFAMGDDPGVPEVTIGTYMISYEDGQAWKAVLAGGGPPLFAHMAFAALGPRRDTAIDNSTIAHEWGHHMHSRLSDGGTQQYGAMSEGWGDFLALHMMIREGDDLDGVYPDGFYAFAAFTPDPYFGLRRTPYSVDFTKNAYTFKNISDGEPLPAGVPAIPSGWPNSEVHNAGEIWATMLFEASVAILKQSELLNAPYNWDEAHRRVADYAVTGLMLTPDNATFTEARDALIAAATAADPADGLLITQAFARRGVGSCAKSPERYSMDLTGVVESYVLDSMAEIALLQVEETDSCDDDGYIDGTESGTVTVQVRNGGAQTLAGASLTLSTTLAGASFPDGATVALPSIAPLDAETLTFPIALDDSLDAMAVLDLTATVTAPGACEPTVVAVLSTSVNRDEVSATSATETAETAAEVWAKTGEGAAEIWRRAQTDISNYVWHGDDYGSPSDTAFESPDLVVHATNAFGISFEHAYSFEADAGGTGELYDGGVIELSEDGGQTWVDISTINSVDPGYFGPLSDCCGNGLAGRPAYAWDNPSYPAMDTVTLDLGTALAGKTVRIRFRISTDAAAGAAGWDIDNIAFSGITNTPFGAVVPDAGECTLFGCGNGTLEQGEQCDNGTANSDDEVDACRTSCRLSHCGDGVVDTGEICDDGDDNSETAPDACRPGCLAPRCGDGVTDDGEECDEGIFNSSAANACRPSCEEPVCGDGTRDDGEQCDDGNSVDTDMCTNSCAWGPGSIGDGVGPGGAPPVRPKAEPEKDDGCSCRVVRSTSSTGFAGLAAGLGLFAAAAVRRRRRR